RRRPARVSCGRAPPRNLGKAASRASIGETRWWRRVVRICPRPCTAPSSQLRSARIADSSRFKVGIIVSGGGFAIGLVELVRSEGREARGVGRKAKGEVVQGRAKPKRDGQGEAQTAPCPHFTRPLPLSPRDFAQKINPMPMLKPSKKRLTCCQSTSSPP